MPDPERDGGDECAEGLVLDTQGRCVQLGRPTSGSGMLAGGSNGSGHAASPGWRDDIEATGAAYETDEPDQPSEDENANVVWNPPLEMDEGETVSVVVRLSRVGGRTTSIGTDLQPEREIASDAIVSPVIEATLTGTGFEIDPDGTQTKRWGSAPELFFEWNVTAVEARSHLLSIHVRALPVEGGEPKDYLRARQEVQVNVDGDIWLIRTIKRAREVIGEMTLFMQALLGFLTAAAAVLIYLGFKKKKKSGGEG